MKYVIYIPLMLLALFIGYHTGGTHHTADEISFTEMKSNGERREELFDAMADSVKRERIPAAELANEQQEILRLIDRSDPVQLFLAQLLIAGREGGNHEVANEELRAGLKENPEKGFKAIAKLFRGLDYDKYPMEKAALMALALETRVGTPLELRELALESLLKDIPPSRMKKDDSYATTEKMYLPGISYEAYLQSTSDAELVMTETLKILETQPDFAIRNNIVNSFNQKFPKHDKILETTISERNIEINYYQNRLPASVREKK